MDNLTHSLVGLAAAKAGLEKLSPGATSLCILAANAADSDIVVLISRDRWSFLQHHRGITHAIVGTIFLSLLLPTFYYVADLLIARIRKGRTRIRFKALLIVSLIVSATHPLLDWTNNYGIRLLLPWNSRWFYGDFVFIVDPFIWLTLGSGCFLLTSQTRLKKIAWTLVGLVVTLLIMASARGANLPNIWLIRTFWLAMLAGVVFLAARRVGERLGSRVALISLALVVVYWGGLCFAHWLALSRAREVANKIAGSNEVISRVVAMPTLANPFRWDCVFETDQATYRFNLALVNEPTVTRSVRYEKPSGQLDRALNEVSLDRRAQIFLGFARFPVAKLSDPNCTSQTLVQLADLRYTEPGTSRGVFSLELPVECSTSLTSNR